jgi:hypothetical protein
MQGRVHRDFLDVNSASRRSRNLDRHGLLAMAMRLRGVLTSGVFGYRWKTLASGRSTHSSQEIPYCNWVCHVLFGPPLSYSHTEKTHARPSSSGLSGREFHVQTGPRSRPAWFARRGYAVWGVLLERQPIVTLGNLLEQG